MKLSVGILLALTLITVPARAQSHPAANAKPVVEINVLPVVESSLARMWDAADAVLEVHIDHSVTNAIARPSLYGREQLPLIETLHTSKVMRALKGDVPKGSSIVFSQSAGQVELSDKIVRVAGLEPLKEGERFVVFLRRGKGGPWLLLGERDGAFRLRDGRVQPQGFGAVAHEHDNIGERTFNDELERVARRARPKA